MPKAFDACRKAGGRIRTIVPKKGTYIHVCYPKGGGSPVKGEVKHTKESETGGSAVAAAIKKRMK